MKRIVVLTLAAAAAFTTSQAAPAGQAPGAASAPDVPISHRDRVYSAEQFSNTISVTDPVDNKVLGVIRLRRSVSSRASRPRLRSMRSIMLVPRCEFTRNEFIERRTGGRPSTRLENDETPAVS